MRISILSILTAVVFLNAALADPPAPPVFDPPAGVYPEVSATNLVLSAPGCRIYYTTDGSRPTQASAFFLENGSIPLQNGRDDQWGAISYIPTTTTDDPYDPWYAPAEPPRKIPVIRAMAVNDNNEQSEIVSATYLLDDVATRYGSTPIFSVQAEPADLFDNTGVNGVGMYVPGTMEGKPKAYDSHVEFFDKGMRQFSQWIELRIQGTSTLTRPKKSLRLTGYAACAGKKGDKKPFQYPFFAGKTNELYSTIVLRLGGNDWNKTLVRDMVAQAISKHTLVDVQYGNACIVFLNGVYWGVHEIRERWETGYFEFQHGGLGSEEFSLLEYGDGKTWPLVDVGLGEDDAEKTSRAYNDFWGLLRQVESMGDNLSAGGNYAAVTNRVNPDSNMQHYGSSLFTGNFDWPQNNQRFWRTFDVAPGFGGDPLNDGRWNWTFHDMDFAFSLPFEYVPDYNNGLLSAQDPYVAIYYDENFKKPNSDESAYVGTYVEDSSRVFRAMLTNEEFQNRYLNFVYLQLATAWSSPVTLGVLDTHAALIREAGMDENGLRWRMPHNAAAWEREVGDIRNYLLARPEAFAWHTRMHFRNRMGAGDIGAPRAVVLDTEGDGDIAIAGFALTPDVLPGVEALPLVVPFPANKPVTVEAIPAEGAEFLGWYATSSNLPPTPAAPIAADSAANYTDWGFDQHPSLGSNWGNWVAGRKEAMDNAGLYVGTSMMPIHGRSENGNSFALYAHSGNGVNVRRELANNRTLGIGETLSLDVGFGLSGGNGGAGAAFIQSGGDEGFRPVELILASGDAWGECFRLHLNGTAYRLDNFPHLVGAPIQMALTRTGETEYTLQLIRAGLTYATDVEIAAAITGIRLYKQPYGDSTDGYNFYFNNLLLTADSPAADDAEDIASTSLPNALLYQNGVIYSKWAGIPVENNDNAGAMIDATPLSNVGIPYFLLYANGGQESSWSRSLDCTLTTNMTLSFDFQNNAIVDESGSVGVNFYTVNGQSFNLQAAYGAPNYTIYVNDEPIDTGVPVVQTGIHVEIQPLDAGTLRVTINGTALTINANSAITSLKFYNFSAGGGTSCNFFFNNLLLTSVVDDGVIIPEDPDNVLFHETGADVANWTQYSEEGSSGTFIDASGAFGLWAHEGALAQRGRSDPLWKYMRPGNTLSFTFQHGDIAWDGTTGWQLYSIQSQIRFEARGNDGQYWLSGADGNAVAIPVAKSTNEHTCSIHFISDVYVTVQIDNFTTNLTLSDPPQSLTFWSNGVGEGENRNVLFNNVKVVYTSENPPVDESSIFIEYGAYTSNWDFAQTGVDGTDSGNYVTAVVMQNPPVGYLSFAIWAHEGYQSTATRNDLAEYLVPGNRMKFNFKHGAIHSGGCVAWALKSGAQTNLALFANAGDANYTLYIGEENSTLTLPLAVSENMQYAAVAFTSDTELELQVGAFVTNLPYAGEPDALTFINEGSGANNDFFFNWLVIFSPDDTDPGGVVFTSDGSDFSNWLVDGSNGSGGWHGSGSESSVLLGGNTLYFYAGGAEDAEANGIRYFPDSVHFGADYELSFQFAHGSLPNEGGSIGWNLYDASGEMYYFLAGHDMATYIANETETSVDVSDATIHTVRIVFSSATTAGVYLDDVLVDDATFRGEPRALRFWNSNGGGGPENNLLVNNITITAPAASETTALSARSVGGSTAQAEGETLLSTDLVYTFTPSNAISILAKFGSTTPTPKTDYEIWAEASGISDLRGTNAATGVSYMEEYLLATNSLSTLHSGADGRYRLFINSGAHGIGNDIQVSDDLTNANSWRAPEPYELEEAPAGPGVYQVNPTNESGLLFIRLKLTPLAAD